MNRYILEEWQTLWNNNIGNKLLEIKPRMGDYQSLFETLEKKLFGSTPLGSYKSHSFIFTTR